MGDTWHPDEVFVTIQGRQQYLWRAVDEDGDVLDILVQSHRNPRTAVRFFRTLLKTQGPIPRRLITDQLRSYAAACRTVMPSVVHVADQYANNRAEVSHQPTRQRSARCGASRRQPTCNGSRRYTELCRISFESGDIYCGRGTTACSESGRSSNGMRRRVRAERARANDLEAEQRTVHTKLTVPATSQKSFPTVTARNRRLPTTTDGSRVRSWAIM